MGHGPPKYRRKFPTDETIEEPSIPEAEVSEDIEPESEPEEVPETEDPESEE